MPFQMGPDTAHAGRRMMIRRLWHGGTALLCATLVVGTPQAAAQEASRPGIVLEEFIFEHAPFASCHAATLVELPDGTLLSAFFGGPAEGDPGVEIWLSRKAPGGHWTPPVSVANGILPDRDRVATWNPVLFQPSGSPLMLFYKVAPQGAAWTGMMLTSADGGHTWSKPQRLEKGYIGPVKNKPIELDDGTIIAGSSTEDNGWRVHVERSSDGGDSWDFIGPLNPHGHIGAIQPTLLLHPDGRLQMLARTQSEHGFMAQSWSEDAGKTWQTLSRGPLPNNNSGFDGVTLADGRHLLVYNHSTRTQEGMGHKGRGILNLAMSDDGLDWGAALVLDYIDEPNKQFSYPSVIQARDGLVHLVYTWHRERIKYVVIDPEQLTLSPIVAGAWPSDGPASLEALRRLGNQTWLPEAR